MTQLHYARKGEITPEMEFVAVREGVSPETVREEIARKLRDLRAAGVGYVLMNGGGSGGGERGRRSLRRFAREVMPAFMEEQAEAADS